MTVPRSEVTLEIAVDSLRKLPEGAGYTAKSGQAGVRVRRKAATPGHPETIVVYASCDSLALQCERYEKTVQGLHKQMAALSQKSQTVSERQPDAFTKALKWFLSGLVAGGIISVIIIKKKK